MKFKRTAISEVRLSIDGLPNSLSDELFKLMKGSNILFRLSASGLAVLLSPADAYRVAAWLKERGAEEVS